MTTAADDRASEDAFEALLAGRPVAEEGAGLATFTAAVRGAADASPGRPNAELAELLSTGLLTDQSSPSARTAPAAGTVRSRGRTRRRSTVIVTALIAKFLSAGAVAQAAAGAGVVVVVVTGAGTAGALPGDAQTAFSELTGIEQTAEEPAEVLPAVEEPVEEDGSLEPTDPAPLDGDTEFVVEEPADGELTEEQWIEGPEDGQPFGAWVSYGATRGWNRDGIVAQKAHERNPVRKAQREVEAPEVDVPDVEIPEVEAPEDEAGDQQQEIGVESADRDDRSSSTGKGGNAGSGKGKGRG